MDCPRVEREKGDYSLYCARAVKAAESRGRLREEAPCSIRTCFQRDTDRIAHAKSFRRLKHKTQVFLQPEGDHYRTRMTHTIEVQRIARTVARALRLNEDLAEAIALGHDLGHTPFGHAGERALDQLCPLGFRHNEQSLRVVDVLEKDGQGLNLCMEVRDGIVHHTGEVRPETDEGLVVRISDRVAYVNHDLDDALRAGILTMDDLPGEIVAATGGAYGKRLDSMIRDLIDNSRATGEIAFSPGMHFVMESFRDFMFEHVYRNPVAKGEERKVIGILDRLYAHYSRQPEALPDDYRALLETEPRERVVCDYIAGMTDKYAIYVYNDLFIPMAWQIR